MSESKNNGTFTQWNITQQKDMVRLDNGVLHSRKKEGAPTLCYSMDGAGEHYAK